MGQNKHANKQAEGKTWETYRQRDPYFILLVSKQLPSGQGLFPVPVPSVLGLPGRTTAQPSATASRALSLCLCADIDCRWDRCSLSKGNQRIQSDKRELAGVSVLQADPVLGSAHVGMRTDHGCAGILHGTGQTCTSSAKRLPLKMRIAKMKSTAGWGVNSGPLGRV